MSSRIPAADHDEPLDADELVRQERVQRERHDQRPDGRPAVLGFGGATHMLRHRLHAQESMDAPIAWACAARRGRQPGLRVGAFSSVGRAPRLHRGCRRFEPGRAHPRRPRPGRLAAAIGWAGASRSRRGPDDDRSAVAARGRRAVGCPGPRHRRSGCRGRARAPRRRRRRPPRSTRRSSSTPTCSSPTIRCSCAGVTSIAEDRYKGALLARLIRADCALARRAHERRRRRARHLGRPRRAARPRRPAPDRAGRRPRPSASAASAACPSPPPSAASRACLADLLPPTATGVRAAGGYDDLVETVALCGGAGDSLLGDPAVRAADVYITADLRHHPASEAREQALVGGGPGPHRRVALGERMALARRRGRRAPRGPPRARRARQRAPHRPVGLPGRAMMTTSTPSPTRSTT